MIQAFPEIYGDKNLFIQALINITQNAVHACTNFAENPVSAFKLKSLTDNPLMEQFIAL